ncbi:MAG TPA: hypothetical protein VIF40_12995 [Methylosinus sp.]|jgi:hypothetical protein|uniref:hypothetical protein n=1 Tax=Methylosinus sp. TaxID=427 RepID=UPI002F92190C
MNFSRWFKAAGADFLDMRLRKLPAGLFKHWYFVRCLAACNGGALPPVEQLAFLLGSRAAVVERRLAALRSAGLLEEVDGELRIVDGDDSAAEEDEESEEETRRPLSAAERTRRWRERRAGGDEVVTAERDAGAVTPEYIEDQILESISSGDGDEPSQDAPDFSAFWRAFPKREGDNPEAPARAAWRKALAGGASATEIMRGARAYAAATAGRERKFIVSAGRWLAEGRYRDAGPPQPSAAVAAAGVWIEAGSTAWSAWTQHWLATKGKRPPIDGKGGWRFPSPMPADAIAEAA